MSEPDSEAWKENATGRERVRMVVEVLEEPATVTAIADEADVAWETANSELERLMAENLIKKHEDDGQTTYGPNLVRQLLDQVHDLIRQNDREELETQLFEYQERVETLQEESDAGSASEFRDRLTEEDRTAAEMREIRNTASMWEALETEIRLTKHAPHFYEDVSGLSSVGDDRGGMTA